VRATFESLLDAILAGLVKRGELDT
jgi:hypothetical protein